MRVRLKKRRNEKLLRPLWPNAGIGRAYQRRLAAIIQEMHDNVVSRVTAAYRKNTPEVAGLAEDESPTAALMKTIRSLGRRWRHRFKTLADELADWFAKSVATRSDAALKAALKKSGFAVEFKLTRAQNDVLQATIAQNVALIRSIPQQYLAAVEGDVTRSVQAGRDLATLTKALQTQFGVTRRRAAFIARDQNSKATAALTRVRRLEIGITEALWLHSHAGKTPRPTHVKMNGQRFEIGKGMWDPDANGRGKGAWIQPGELINCKCSSRPIVPGFS